MVSRRLRHAIIASIALMLGGGCTEHSQTSAPAIPSVQPNSGDGPELSPVSATATDLIPTPSPPWANSTISDDFLFAPSPVACPLPCWYGLSVGTSHSNDIQPTLEHILGFAPEIVLEDEPAPAGMTSTAYVWRFDTQNSYEEFWITFTETQDTGVLEGIKFIWTYEPYNSQMSPQHIITELGTPSYWLVSVASAGNAGGLRTLLIYDTGVAVWIDSVVPIALADGVPSTLEFCMRGEHWNDQTHNASSGEAYITPPLVNGLEELSPLQEQYYGGAIDWFKLVPAEGLFGASLDQLAQIAVRGGCAYSSAFE